MQLNLRTTSKLFTLAAGAGFAAFAQNAEAQIVYSGPVNIQIPLTTAGIYINVVTGVSNTSPGAVPGWDINPFSGTNLSWFGTATLAQTGFVRGGGTSATLVDNLALATLVSATTPGTPNYTANNSGASESSGATAFVLNSSNNYVGFRFLNEGTGLVTYGWLQVSVGASFTDPARSIIGWAYETSGAGIAVGDTGAVAVPEPGTYLAGLAAGALALRAWRRRKAQAA